MARQFFSALIDTFLHAATGEEPNDCCQLYYLEIKPIMTSNGTTSRVFPANKIEDLFQVSDIQPIK